MQTTGVYDRIFNILLDEIKIKTKRKYQPTFGLIDRSGTDLTRIAGKVCKKSDHKEIFHTVLTQHGILANSYRAGDLEPYSRRV